VRFFFFAGESGFSKIAAAVAGGGNRGRGRVIL
jgi:hypothetical protein